MPGSTPIYGFPYPDPSDLVANYPALGQQLAEDVEDEIAASSTILQVVRATDVTERSTTSSTFVDVTGMSVTITPQKATSDILLIASFSAKPQVNSSTVEMHVQITDASNVAISGGELVKIGHVALDSLATVDVYQQATVIARSSPATTSATTYKLRFLRVSSTTAIIANNINTGQMYAIEVSP